MASNFLLGAEKVRLVADAAVMMMDNIDHMTVTVAVLVDEVDHVTVAALTIVKADHVMAALVTVKADLVTVAALVTNG